MIESKIYKLHTLLKIAFYLSLIGSYIFAILPSNLAPTIGHFSDKTHHIFAFVVLSLLLQASYRVPYLRAFLLLFSYGVFIEFSQLFAVNRSAEFLDVVADTLGVALGLILFFVLCKLFSSSSLCNR